MPQSLAFAASLALAAMFAWAAAAKLFRPAGWRAAISGYGLGRGEPLAFVTVPGVELLVAVTILWVSARAGAALSLTLLASFSAAVVHARSQRGDRLPCGCFGRATERDYRALLARNACAGCAAALVLLGGGRDGIAGSPSVTSGPELVPVALTCLGAALAGWTLWRTGVLRGGGRR